MDKHEQAKDKLDAYLDDELTAVEKRLVETHLIGCEDCRRSVAEWTRARRLFAKIPEPAAPDAFTMSVIERIQPKRTFLFTDVLKWAVPTFALTAATVSFLTIWPANEPYAMETAILKEGGPITIQEIAADVEEDWTGLEAL